MPHTLSQAPEELTRTRLRRIGEGIGKVVFASEHWVVKRQRTPSEILALILIWKALRRVQPWLPWGLGRQLLERPSGKIRLLRRLLQPVVKLLPRAFWLSTHAGGVSRQYRLREQRGEQLAREHLAGTHLIPAIIRFPPTHVRVDGWPGWLVVTEAVERVESTLHQRLIALSREERFQDVEQWLDRLLGLRQMGWQRGVFSTDAHLKNFGVIGERLVLLDAGGLTRTWKEIEQRLAYEDVVTEPHIQLGLGEALGACPEIAERFNARWKQVVRPEVVQQHWPAAAARS